MAKVRKNTVNSEVVGNSRENAKVVLHVGNGKEFVLRKNEVLDYYPTRSGKTCVTYSMQGKSSALNGFCVAEESVEEVERMLAKRVE